MKNVLLALAMTLTALSGPAIAQSPPRQPADDDRPGEVRGIVTSEATGRPLRRVQMALRPIGASGFARPLIAHTNVAGRYHFKDVPPGTYTVLARRPGYLSLEYGQRRTTESGITIEVRAGRLTDRIDVALPSAGVLAGRIVDDLGEPYPGVQVTALAMRYRRGQRVPERVAGDATNDLGEFRIGGLQSGSYYLVAVSSELWKTVEGQTWGYASTYFPGGPSDRAQVIALGLSEQRNNLNFTLNAGPTARLRGQVLRESGQPAANAPVSLMYSFPGVVMVAGRRTTRTAPDGTFEFDAVPGGTYDITSGGASEIITVTGADIDGVMLVPKVGSAVSGIVLTDEGVTPPFPTAGVRVSLEAPTDKVLPTVRIVSVDKDWTFRCNSLGGPFLFRAVGLPAGWMLGAVRLNGKDITDVPYDVPTGGKDITGLEVVVTQRIGRAEGVVVDDAGRPTFRGTVLVFVEDPQYWIPYSRRVRATRPGADGRFSIAELPPGSYRAIVREDIENGQWEDRTFLESVRNDGTAFVLGEGETATLTLRLAR